MRKNKEVFLFPDPGFYDRGKKEPPYQENSLSDRMVGIGKPLLRASFSSPVQITDIKLIFATLSQIRWAEKGNRMEVRIPRKDLCDVLGVFNDHHAPYNIRRMGERMMHMSMIKMTSTDRKSYKDGFLIYDFAYDGIEQEFIIRINESFRPLLENLIEARNFLTIWANDVYRFTSYHSYLLYQSLRLHSDTRVVNTRLFTTAEIKCLFSIPDDGAGAYRYKSKEGRSKVNWSAIELKILDPASREVANSKMIWLYPCENKGVMKFYRKVKSGRKIIGYEFKYQVMTQRRSSTKPFLAPDM